MKGIVRKSSYISTKTANVIKCLEFLRKIEKVNPRHLYSVENIVNGDKMVIWEILFDIWSYYAKEKNGNTLYKKNMPDFRSHRTVDKSLKTKRPSKSLNEEPKNKHYKNSEILHDICNMKKVRVGYSNRDKMTEKMMLNNISYFSGNSYSYYK